MLTYGHVENAKKFVPIFKQLKKDKLTETKVTFKELKYKLLNQNCFFALLYTPHKLDDATA